MLPRLPPYFTADSWEAARTRERQIKKWNRAWKLREIEGFNPERADLYDRVALP